MSAARPGDILVLHTPDGLRFQLVKGVPEGDEAEVLAAAIDRVEAWDKSQELGPWVANIRPGIGARAYPAGPAGGQPPLGLGPALTAWSRPTADGPDCDRRIRRSRAASAVR